MLTRLERQGVDGVLSQVKGLVDTDDVSAYTVQQA